MTENRELYEDNLTFSFHLKAHLYTPTGAV